MVWCLTSGAVGLGLMSLLVLIAKPPRLRYLHPALVVRGCLFVTLLLAAGLLASVALLWNL